MARPFEAIKALDRAVRLALKPVREIFERAVAALRSGVTDREIRDAIRRGNAAPILDSEAWEDFENILLEVFAEDGPIAATIADASRRAAREPPLKGQSIGFEALDRKTARYLERHGARLVRDVKKSVRQSIRDIVRNSSRSGTVREAARAILDIRGFGLARDQGAKFNRWARKLYDQAANPRSDVFDLSEKELQRLLDREYQRRLRVRARTIAQTEAYDAGNDARRRLWREAADQGALDDTKYLLQWVTRVIDVCPRCEALSGKTAEIVDGVFVSDVVAEGRFEGETITIEQPTVHPRCYCAIRTVRRKDVEKTRANPVGIQGSPGGSLDPPLVCPVVSAVRDPAHLAVRFRSHGVGWRCQQTEAHGALARSQEVWLEGFPAPDL